MADHKRQHFVPRCYLNAWVDPETPVNQTSYVHLFDKNGCNARRKSPANILRMPDLYTIFRDGERDLLIERAFSQWESDFVRVRGILQDWQFGNSKDAADLYAFVGAMLARPPHRINFVREQWKSVVELMREVKANLNPASSPIRSLSEDGLRMNLAQVQEMADNPMGTWFPDAVAAYVEILIKSFGCDVLVNDTPGHSFLTSDAPAVIFHPTLSDPRFRHMPRGLGSPGCEVTLPLSPRLALLFRHKSPGIHAFIAVDWEGVYDINYRTLMAAKTTIISDKPDIFFVRTITDYMAAREVERPSSPIL